jgi:hypothetical protein
MRHRTGPTERCSLRCGTTSWRRSIEDRAGDAVGGRADERHTGQVGHLDGDGPVIEGPDIEKARILAALGVIRKEVRLQPSDRVAGLVSAGGALGEVP